MKSWPWWLPALGVSLVIAALLSPLASQDPDGLNKVAQDLGFHQKATPSLVQDWPVSQFFNGYTLRGLNDPFWAKAAAGVGGSLVVFGGTWALGAWLRRGRDHA